MMLSGGDNVSVERLGILGGTFDPPHIAHLIAGELAVEQFALDQLLFIPANIPPHKIGHEIASSDDRYAMAELATQGNPRFAVSDIEIIRQGNSYMIDTIHELRKAFEPTALYLFIGLDNLAIFESWHKWEEIFEQCEVVVMARPSHQLDRITPKLRDRVKFRAIPLMEISSTDIRERIHNGKSVRYMVPESVRSYIVEHKLYL
jgi:nicotinate-nucleotide adenylyltransferase